jgi:hypothetical protein
MDQVLLERPSPPAIQACRVLHVGCGAAAGGRLPHAFAGPNWEEVRLDIDPEVAPDIIASITDMAAVASGSMQALYSSHNLEHLAAHEVPLALAEFRRVLAPDGMVLITLPDLQSVAELIAAGKLNDPAYISPLGPITPLDIVYGFGPALARGNDFMGHRTGFTDRSLLTALIAAGFADGVVQRSASSFSLWAIAYCACPDAGRLHEDQTALFPHPVPQPGLEAVAARL